MLGQKSRRGKEGQDLLDPLEVGFRPNWAKLKPCKTDLSNFFLRCDSWREPTTRWISRDRAVSDKWVTVHQPNLTSRHSLCAFLKGGQRGGWWWRGWEWRGGDEQYRRCRRGGSAVHQESDAGGSVIILMRIWFRFPRDIISLINNSLYSRKLS